MIIEAITDKSYSNSNSEKRDLPAKIAEKEKQRLITNLNRQLRKYLKKQEKITVFDVILIMFKKQQYEIIELFDIHNNLMNEFNKNKDKYIIEKKGNSSDQNGINENERNKEILN